MLALKVLGKSMDATAPNPDMFEVGILQKDAQGNLIQRKIEWDELMQILQTNKIFDEEDSQKWCKICLNLKVNHRISSPFIIFELTYDFYQ